MSEIPGKYSQQGDTPEQGAGIYALALPSGHFAAPFAAVKARVLGFSVVDATTLGAASVLLREIKSWRHDIEQECRPRVVQAHSLWKGLVADLHDLDAPWADLEREVKQRVNAYHTEQVRIANEAKAHEEARVREERARLEAEARAAEEAGEIAVAAVARAEAVDVVPQPVAVMPAKVQGLVTREVWKAEVEDLQAFLVAVIEGTIPSEAISVNTAWLREQATRHKGELRLPGVRVWSESTTAVR